VTLVSRTPHLAPPAPKKRRKIDRRRLWALYIPLALICLIGAYLRWIHLGAESLWFDEGMTAWLVGVPFKEMTAFMRQDASFPLLFVLLKGWTKLFGDSEAGMRSLSALAATLSLIVVARLAWGITKSNLATIGATLIFAVSPLQVEYAKDARYYALLCLFLLIAFECVRTHLENNRVWPLIVFALAAAASLYTHQIAAFYLLGIDIAWLILPSEQPMRIRLRNAAMANMAVVVLYAPWLPIALDQVRWTANHFWAQPPDGNEFLRTFSALAGGKPYQLKDWLLQSSHFSTPDKLKDAFVNAIHLTTPEQVAGIVLVISTIALLAPLMIERLSRAAVALLVVAIYPLLLIYLYSLLGKPAFIERVFIASTPPLALLAAMPLASRSGRWIAAPLVLGMLAINAGSTHAVMQLSHKENWRGAEAYVAKLPTDSHRLLVFVANEGQLAFDYYARRSRAKPTWSLETGAPGGYFDVNPPQVLRQVKTEADLANLAQLVKGEKFDEVVVIKSHPWWADPNDLVGNSLYDEYNEIGGLDFNGVMVSRWERREGGSSSFGNEMRDFADRVFKPKSR
jgi:4-amino-4-deoxy-L-arabinose transferase-like glycosyltransferase